ncbi:MAG: hypothetical protein FJX76_13915 [Armatimonadetes bacterium]|nr:hypothetical protein [Armatimonadota bacterium]
MRVAPVILLVMLLAVTVSWAQAERIVVVDGRALASARWQVDEQREPWFPIADIARALGVTVSCDASGVQVKGRAVACTVREMGGFFCASRADLKKVLGVAVFVDSATGRASVTSASGLRRLSATAKPAASTPSRPAAAGNSRRPSATANVTPLLDVVGASVGRDGGPLGNLMVSARLVNRTERPMRDVLVKLIFWDAAGGSAFQRC